MFLTPQHILEKPGKKDRQIFDGSRRFTPFTTPVNMMTSTKDGVELDCLFGDTFENLLTRIWNLRITYPCQDIIIHANDVKSCFRQIKHHPDVAGAFSSIVAQFLFLQCGLTFGSDFSPAAWEVCRRIAEQLATALFDEQDLVVKHDRYLSDLNWGKHLGKASYFTPATSCARHQGVLDEAGSPAPTPHGLFVDDDLIAEVYDRDRIRRAIAAGIEAIFIILGESDLKRRQDPISWDKLYEMLINYVNVALGLRVNTRTMLVSPTQDFMDQLHQQLAHWHSSRRSFQIPEMESLIGKLSHVAKTSRWLNHLLGHLFTSLSASLGASREFLITNSRTFRALLSVIKHRPEPETDTRQSTFAQAETARRIHKTKRLFHLNATAKEELRIIRTCLLDPTISKHTPIAHLVRSTPDTTAAGDSSLHAMGGYSFDMGFWWYYEWPPEIRRRTIKLLSNDADGSLVAINGMEYATQLVNYAAAYHYWVIQRNCERRNIPYPCSLFLVDNTTAESWIRKGCKSSLAGRALGRLFCALMINSPVGIYCDYIDTKSNCVADDISRILTEHQLLASLPPLLQKYPSLSACKRYHPSPVLISFILDALLSKQPADPLKVRQLVHKNPGKIAGLSIAEMLSSPTLVS